MCLGGPADRKLVGSGNTPVDVGVSVSALVSRVVWPVREMGVDVHRVKFGFVLWVIGWVGLSFLLTGMATAQVSNQQGGSKPTAVSEAPERAQQVATATVPLIDQPLRLEDFAGMQPRADLRDKLGQVSGFIQNTPSDGKQATEATEVWLGHTKSTFYAVFLCFDSHPSLIRTHLARRENIQNDDNVTVLLDPFQDRRRGVQFQVNATGVQADAAGPRRPGPTTAMTRCGTPKGALPRKGGWCWWRFRFEACAFAWIAPDGGSFSRGISLGTAKLISGLALRRTFPAR